MSFSKKDLMDKLGVGYELGPYETCPFSALDSEGGRTCSAEARMDPDGVELEAEIQMVYDSPPDGKPPMEQICLIKAKPIAGEEYIVTLRIKGEPFGDKIYNWQEKSLNFFRAVVQELQAGTIPDIDELIDREFHNRERMGSQRQGGGGKAPKMKGGQLLGMKKGGSF
jgi:hypothetical protein